MKRWDFTTMMNVGSKLFANIHKRKRYAHANHEVHLIARSISDWLTQGVQSIINGTYIPRFLRRYYFKDEMVDRLHISDRILQMVNDGISTHRIKSYLNRWCSWWVRSSQSWQYQELLGWFLHVCHDTWVRQIAIELIQETKAPILLDLPVYSDVRAIA